MCSKGGSCSSLNRLNLDVAVKQLQDKSSIVEKLELLDAGIDDSGAKRLAEALQLDNHHSIKSLYLNANKISDVGFIALIEALKKCNSIETLNLNGNNIGDVGALALVNFLDNHENNLKSVYLLNNPIGEKGCASLDRAKQSHAGVNVFFRRLITNSQQSNALSNSTSQSTMSW